MPNSANVNIATHNQIKNFQSCYLHHETQENLHLGKITRYIYDTILALFLSSLVEYTTVLILATNNPKPFTYPRNTCATEFQKFY